MPASALNNDDISIELDSKMRRRVSSRESSSPVNQSVSVPAWIEYSDQTNKRVAYLFLVSSKAKGILYCEQYDN